MKPGDQVRVLMDQMVPLSGASLRVPAGALGELVYAQGFVWRVRFPIGGGLSVEIVVRTDQLQLV